MSYSYAIVTLELKFKDSKKISFECSNYSSDGPCLQVYFNKGQDQNVVFVDKLELNGLFVNLQYQENEKDLSSEFNRLWQFVEQRKKL